MDNTVETIKNIIRECDRLYLSFKDDRAAQSPQMIYAGNENEIFIALERNSDVFRYLHLHPHQTLFTIQDNSRELSLKGECRALIMGNLAEHPEFSQQLKKKGALSQFTNPADAKPILLKLIPEKIKIQEKNNIVRQYTTPAGTKRPGQIKLWLQAIRLFSLSFTVITGLIGTGFALYYNGPVQWSLIPFILLGAFMFHVGTNLTSEYYDYMHNVDRPETLGGTKLIVDGFLSPKAVLRAGILVFLLGTLIGFYIIYRVDWWILAFGLVGLVGGYFYGAGPLQLKYRALGEFMVFICFGPFMVIGAYYALTANFSWNVFLASFPIGFLIVAVLEANNTRDILNDAKANIKTIPIKLGLKFSLYEYAFLVGGAYLFTLVLVALGSIPAVALVVFLSLPVAFKNIRDMLQIEHQDSPVLRIMDLRTAQLVTQFGLLFVLSLFIARYFS